MSFNLVVFVIILRILIRHSYQKFKKTKQDRRVKGVLKTLMSLFSITVMFGFQWLFGALTIADASLAFRWLFVIFSTLQGFFLFFFFVILRPDARDEWMQVMNLGRKRGTVLSQSFFSRSSKGNTDTSSSTLLREIKKNVLLSQPVSPKPSTVDVPMRSVIEEDSVIMVNIKAASGESESNEKKDTQVPPHILERKSVSPQSDKPPSYPSPPSSPIDEAEIGNVIHESLSAVGKSPPIIFVMTNPKYSHSSDDETTHM